MFEVPTLQMASRRDASGAFIRLLYRSLALHLARYTSCYSKCRCHDSNGALSPLLADGLPPLRAMNDSVKSAKANTRLSNGLPSNQLIPNNSCSYWTHIQNFPGYVGLYSQDMPTIVNYVGKRFHRTSHIMPSERRSKTAEYRTSF